MSDLITVTGVIGSDPRAIVTSRGLPITSFRLASTRRYFDREKGAWEDGETNWFSVSAFRRLAFNANASLRKGQHVIVHGRLKLRAWQAGERSGTAVEIEAESIGHDLTWGITQLRRLEREPSAETSESGASSSLAGSADHGVRDGEDGSDAPIDPFAPDAPLAGDESTVVVEHGGWPLAEYSGSESADHDDDPSDDLDEDLGAAAHADGFASAGLLV